MSSKEEDENKDAEEETKMEDDVVEEKQNVQEESVDDRKKKIQQALNSFWYRLFYKHSDKNLRCMYFPATQFVEIFKTFEKGKYSVVYMTRDINLNSWKKISKHRNHTLDRFADMWIGR